MQKKFPVLFARNKGDLKIWTINSNNFGQYYFLSNIFTLTIKEMQQSNTTSATCPSTNNEEFPPEVLYFYFKQFAFVDTHIFPIELVQFVGMSFWERCILAILFFSSLDFIQENKRNQ